MWINEKVLLTGLGCKSVLYVTDKVFYMLLIFDKFLPELSDSF